MKQKVTHQLVQLEKEELQKLCREVRETLATDIVMAANKPATKITASGLWKLQRNMRTASQRWNGRNSRLFIRG